jgi:predicted dehydrogenase
MAYRWGIIGTGGIARAMAGAITAEGDEVVAVSSASQARADDFAAANGVARAYGRHSDLVADDEVDVVYVATTNDRHHLDVRACIEAGRPALVEKPFTLNTSTARELLAAAEEAGVLVAEAMWMKVQPAFVELQRRIAAGEIGEPRLVQADFGIVADPDPTRRWFSLEQGGGALLDVGIYPLTFAIALLGPPVEIRALGELADTGVDAQVAVSLRHRVGVSSIVLSFVADSGIEATIAGPEGSLRLHGEFHNATHLSRRRRTEVVEHLEVPDAELGLRHEVREMQRCLGAGLTESEVLTHAGTLDVLAAMDEVREQLGLTYPPLAVADPD